LIYQKFEQKNNRKNVIQKSYSLSTSETVHKVRWVIAFIRVVIVAGW